MAEVVRIGEISVGDVWRAKNPHRLVRVLRFEVDYEWRFRDGRRVRVESNTYRVLVQTIPGPGKRQSMPSLLEIESFLKRFERYQAAPR